MKKFILGLAALTLIVLLSVFILQAVHSRDVGSLVETLFSSQSDEHKKIFSFTMTDSLPDPVRRYFRFALKEGLPIRCCARLTHEGRFRTGLTADWSAIKGEEYLLGRKPGFVWKGALPFVSAVDSYISSQGALDIYLLSAFRIISGKGSQYDQGELLRWLGECVWIPTALLPGPHIQWKSVDSDHADLVCTDGKLSVSYRVTFSQRGEIVRIDTMRYKDGEHLEKWTGLCSGYGEHAGMMIPERIIGSWILPGGEFSYADFTISAIDYDVMEKF